MQRISHNHALTINLENPVQGAPYGFTVTLTQLTVINDGQKTIGQPLQNVIPFSDEDATPEFLASVNAQLASCGLVLSKIPV